MNKKKPYISVTYLCSRIFEKIYRFLFPTLPWLSPTANNYLRKNLKPSWIGFEYGSGRSTIWLAKRVTHLTSVEHNPIWFEKISKKINQKKLSNVILNLVHREEDKEPEGVLSNYVSILSMTPDRSFDFILVDGVYRAECSKIAVQKLKPGGLLIIDDAHRYLPSSSRSPFARKLNDGPASETWEEILRIIKAWTCKWTSNGVSDTAIFIKPK